MGLVGVILVGLSVVAALGLLSYIRLKGTMIIIEVVPFLVLAVGTDNLFILTHAYEVSNIVMIFHLVIVTWSRLYREDGIVVSSILLLAS